MGIDIAQFRETYFEECFEGLDIMERGLLELGEGSADSELINEVFRAAHSIKGGAGTYGFADVGRLTHVMETLLDAYRTQSSEVEPEAVQALLAAVDCLREIFAAARAGDTAAHELLEDLIKSITAFLADDTTQQQSVSAAQPGPSEEATVWKIRFGPSADLFKSGTDPLRLIRCLHELGSLLVATDVSSVPDWTSFDPECCYLSFDMVLTSTCHRDEIDSVFEWLSEDSEVSIEAVEEEAETVQLRSDPGPSTRPDGSGGANSERARKGASDSGSIRVGIDKVDTLINMVGELVITQSMLSQIGQAPDASALERMRDGLLQLERNTRELQESVMRIRMVPMSFAFGRVPRVVHDVAAKLGKKVHLEVLGEQTELDKTVMERIHDPLVHIVRNSLDHGLEGPVERIAAGKSEFGTIRLNAYHHGGNIVIEVSDDGRGLDIPKIEAKCRDRGLLAEGETLSPEAAAEMICAPGFSTADQVTEVSGRGVGMDVVKRNIVELGGSIGIQSQSGAGMTITIRLPLTLAILDGQTIRVGNEKYILPLGSILETVQVQAKNVDRLAGDAEVIRLRDERLRIIRLGSILDVEGAETELDGGLIVVVEGGREKVGLFVDELLGQQQIVIKSLETNFEKIEGISGATILGDGRVALILDVAGVIRVWLTRQARAGRRDCASMCLEEE